MSGILLGLLSMIGWGTADFLATKASRRIGEVLTLFWMQTVGSSIALVYFLLNSSSFNPAKIPGSLFLLIVIGFLQLISYLFYYRGLKKGKASLVSPVSSCWVAITVILSVIFLNELLKTNQIVSIVLIILGILLISVNLKEILKIRKMSVLTGTKEGIIAMLGWGFSMFLMVLAFENLGWFLPVLLFGLFSLLFLSFYILINKQSLKLKPEPSLLVLLLPIGFLDIGSFFSFSFGVQSQYASIVAPIAASSPLITILLAKIFLKERFTLNQTIGAFIIISGLILISL